MRQIPCVVSLCSAFAMLLSVIVGCTEPEPLYCDGDEDCLNGYRCDLPIHTCVPVESDSGQIDSAIDVGSVDAAQPDTTSDILGSDGSLLQLGADCTAGTQCSSGFCADGVCCKDMCDGVCRSCNLQSTKGTCVYTKKGEDPRKDCSGTDPSCSGLCDGMGACEFADPTTTCKTASCTSSTLTTYNCDGKGSCQPKNKSCEPYICNANGSACLTSCSKAGDCTSAGFCITGGKCLTWTPSTSGTSQVLTGIWGSSASDIWVVGAAGTILHYTNGSWQSVTSPTTNALLSIWGSSATDIWATGASGTILHYTNSSWQSVISPTSQAIWKIWGSAANKIWGAGEDHYVYHYDGSTWKKDSVDSGWPLKGVWGSSASDVWVTGNNGTILHNTNGSWQSVTSGTTDELKDVWGTSASEVWAVGVSGTMLKYDGATWTKEKSAASAILYTVWVTPNSEVWIGGDPALMYNDGTTWQSLQPPPPKIIDIFGLSVTDIWAVGDAGTILHAQ